jgi:hypothetical protein
MMIFDLEKAKEIISRTPETLNSLLSGLSDEWIYNNEGDKSWNPFDILGHLIHGEKTDWLPRIRIILSQNENTKFEAFDRFAQFDNSVGKTMDALLNEFAALREKNIRELESMNISDEVLIYTGVHPEFGNVMLSQLISSWVVHDLGHIAQLSRVMASQYIEAVGPWKPYMSILGHRK